jgi:sulfur dioxygenase
VENVHQFMALWEQRSDQVGGTQLEIRESGNRHSDTAMPTTCFRQIADPRSSGYAYLLGDLARQTAVVVDPAPGQVPLLLGVLRELDLRVVYVVLTHAHDDAPAAAALAAATGARVAAGRLCPAPAVGVHLAHNETLCFGEETLRCLETPGHTPGCVSWQWRDRVFTGDTLLIGDCSPACETSALYDSIMNRLLSLPDETLVYPAHDFARRRVSCIAEERERNPALAGVSRDEFIARQTARASEIRKPIGALS